MSNYKDEQKKARELLKPKLMKGYRFNVSPNRAYRRLNNDEFVGENVQTYIKPQPSKEKAK